LYTSRPAGPKRTLIDLIDLIDLMDLMDLSLLARDG
jgi:hypothetical protein